MKPLFFSVVLSVCLLLIGGFALAPVLVSAQDGSVPQNQELLAKIEAELKTIEAKVQLIEKAIRIVNENNPPFSISFSRGYWGFEVEELQEVLSQDPAIYPQGFVTGYFGPLTEAAVKIFQTRFGLENTGFVGPKTRGKLRQYILDSVNIVPGPSVSPQPLAPSASPSAESSTSPSPSVSATPSPSPSLTPTPTPSPSPIAGSCSAPTPSPSPSPAFTPRAIPHGKKGFSVGQSNRTVPQFSKGFIDPYDPASGETQTVTIAVKHPQPITRVTAVLKTDHAASNPVQFTLTSGTNTDGQWQGSWRVNDTYLYTYALILNAVSSSGSASVEITLR